MSDQVGLMISMGVIAIASGTLGYIFRMSRERPVKRPVLLQQCRCQAPTRAELPAVSDLAALVEQYDREARSRRA